MKKFKLNENMGEIVKAHGYELDAEERYVINIERELSEQSAIMAAIQSVGLPALNDYHQWLIYIMDLMPICLIPQIALLINFMERKLCGKQIYRKVLL